MASSKLHMEPSFRRTNRVFQIGCAVFFLTLGGLLLATLVLQAPSLMNGVLSGDKSAAETLISGAAGTGLCWLQWRYRHVIYPQLRRDFRIVKRKVQVIASRSSRVRSPRL